MMYADRLNQIMVLLGAKNRQIAAYEGFDASLLTHLRKGSRIPTRDGASSLHVTDGIIRFADEHDRLSELCELTGADARASHEGIREQILNWLYEGMPASRTRKRKNTRKASSEKTRKKTFDSPDGERFDLAMDLGNLSNQKLSSLAHVDASVVSRYRAGLRTLRSNPQMIGIFTGILWHRIVDAGNVGKLADVMMLPVENVSEDAFGLWLGHRESDTDGNSQAAERLLEAFDSYSAEMGAQHPKLAELDTGSILRDTRTEYFGDAGLREAVIRFLLNAVQAHSEELLLFSDQSMSWMTGDPQYFYRWAALMSACVKNGTRIRIIHNIDRDLNEMSGAIISWLPLYMSGMIESYFCPLPRGERFTHTLFLDPGRSCIRAFHVAGRESHGIYHYDTGSEALSCNSEQFDQLLKVARPLVKTLSPTVPYRLNGDLTIISPMLSPITMPESLCEVFQAETLSKMRAWLQDSMNDRKRQRIYECVPLIPGSFLEKNRIPLDRMPGTEELSYTGDQYREHINNLIRIMKERPDYRLVPLPVVPFVNMKLWIGKDVVRITRASEPFISFQFTHPLMCDAFCDYADRLIRRYRKNRRTLIKELTQDYIREK